MCILHNEKKMKKMGLHVLILQQKYSLFQYLNECKHIMIQNYAKKKKSFVVVKYTGQYM